MAGQMTGTQGSTMGQRGPEAAAGARAAGGNGAGATVVGVRFRPAGRVYYYSPAGHELKVGQWVIVEGGKGLECARVVIAPRQVVAAELGGDAPRPVLRPAE